MTMTPREQRDAVVQAIVADEVERYLHEMMTGELDDRECLTCLKAFTPRHRWHFFCATPCRDEWYRGQIRPRAPKRAARRRRAA